MQEPVQPSPGILFNMVSLQRHLSFHCSYKATISQFDGDVGVTAIFLPSHATAVLLFAVSILVVFRIIDHKQCC